MPLEGSLLVNGETQKRSEEILAEVAIALTLSKLRDPISESHSACIARMRVTLALRHSDVLLCTTDTFGTCLSTLAVHACLHLRCMPVYTFGTYLSTLLAHACLHFLHKPVYTFGTSLSTLALHAG